MPFTGYDPQEHGGPIDMSGGGLDPSYAWALAPGGRFNGDEWEYLEYLAALDPSSSRTDDGVGPLDANPNYHVPDWLKNNKSIIGKLLALHEKNVQQSHGGTVSNPLEHGGNSFYSGPGADYGPNKGPTRGLVDQNTGNIFDGPDHRPEGSSESVPGGGGGHHGGGGGGYNGPVGPMIPDQPNYTPSFLGWQPNNTGAPQFTGAANARATAPAVPIPKGPTPPPGGWQGKWRGPNRGGGAGTAPADSGGSGGAGGAGGGSGGGGTGKDGTYTLEDAARELGLSPEDLKGLGLGLGAHGGAPGSHMKQDFGQNEFRGYDVNMLGSNTPGWLRDPTSAIYDTSGMPNPTAPTRNQGESTDDYMTRLHDAGFNNRDIATMVGNGQTGFGMGGTVVRGPEGYQFGNFVDQYAPGPHYDIGNKLLGFAYGPDGKGYQVQQTQNDPHAHDLGENQQGPTDPRSQQGISDSMADFLNSGGAGGGGGRDESIAGIWQQFMGAFI